MQQYHDLLEHILEHGTDKKDRTGVGTRSVFGYQMRFDLKDYFPLLGSKFTPFKLVVTELLWFLKGNPDIFYLHENNCHIWDQWVFEDGTFGPIYGQQWRSWPNYYGEDIDQIANVIKRLREDPSNRRLIVSAWNVADVESGNMALPPCHALFQFYTRPLEGENRLGLSCQLYQRSADVFLGVPFNIASYSLLVHMIAYLTDMVPDEFIWTGGDVHLYQNHFDQSDELLSRNHEGLSKPQLKIDDPRHEVHTIDDFTMKHLKVVGYEYLPAIKAPIAV